MFDQTNNQNDAAGDRVGFCQNCGKPLTRETIRAVGAAVYCEPCLEARLAGAAPHVTGAAPSQGYGTVNAGYPGSVPPLITGTPNPALAALLGLIPGVGAMYNEQYAKGIVHLVIFAVLVSLSHTVEIFGLFVAGWVLYMAIEAHHTARARRDGTPLPNPFGLNEIGERMGFGRNWPPPGARPTDATQPVPPYATSPPYTATQAPAGSSAPPNEVPPGAGWGAPTDRYGYSAPVTAAYPPMPPYGAGLPSDPGGLADPGSYGPGSSYGPAYAGYDSRIPPYAPVPPFMPEGGLQKRNQFPIGAIWLIVLGVIFLVANTGLFHGVAATALVGVGLITLGIWIFVRKMMYSGVSLQNDGSPMYRVRVLRALRGSAWVVLTGLLLLLNSLHWMHWTWARTWPYFIILAGVLAILERTASNSTANVYLYPPANTTPGPGYPNSAAYAPAPETPAAIIPAVPSADKDR